MKRLVPPDMRNHFTLKGDPKRKYSKASAQRHALRYNQVAYECSTCKGWHLASIKETK